MRRIEFFYVVQLELHAQHKLCCCLFKNNLEVFKTLSFIAKARICSRKQGANSLIKCPINVFCLLKVNIAENGCCYKMELLG